jgi:hypothetical protein
LRYGLPVALSTLSSCRCLHKPKTRFPVGRLIPLSGAGISPAESIRFVLTRRNTSSVLVASRPRRCRLGDVQETSAADSEVGIRLQRRNVEPAPWRSSRPDLCGAGRLHRRKSQSGDAERTPDAAAAAGSRQQPAPGRYRHQPTDGGVGIRAKKAGPRDSLGGRQKRKRS